MSLTPVTSWLPGENGSVGILAIAVGPLRIRLELFGMERRVYAVWRESRSGRVLLVQLLGEN